MCLLHIPIKREQRKNKFSKPVALKSVIQLQHLIWTTIQMFSHQKKIWRKWWFSKPKLDNRVCTSLFSQFFFQRSQNDNHFHCWNALLLYIRYAFSNQGKRITKISRNTTGKGSCTRMHAFPETYNKQMDEPAIHSQNFTLQTTKHRNYKRHLCGQT